MKFGVDYIGIFAAAICFDAEGNFLMGKRGGQARDRHGEWEFPGGGVEIGESIEAALTRELREECGTEPTRLQQVLVKEFIERGMHYCGFYYAAEIDRDAVYVAEPVYDEFAWFTLETVPDTVKQKYYFDIIKAAIAVR